MSRVSINGALKPTNNEDAKERYLGHFLKVSYIQEIGGSPIYSKDRIDVEKNGAFRFYLPKEELLRSQSVTISVFAPDGEQLGTQIYSFSSLHAADIAENVADDTLPLILQVDPKVIQFNQSGPILDTHRKITGKVVDISGERKASGVHILILTSSDPAAAIDSQSFQPIFSTQTDQDGSFFGRIDNKSYEQAYGLIAGLEDTPIRINLDEKKIPKNIILVSDLSALSGDISQASVTPKLPDGIDMVGNASFSQDIGGKCVDFTIPNRTLEEFSFYHTVRTTEPEIRGLTITANESKNTKLELLKISDDLFTIFGQLNNSMSSLAFVPDIVDEEKTESPMVTSKPIEGEGENTPQKATSNDVPASTAPVYHVKLDAGIGQVRLNFKDLLRFEQARRKPKLQQLHQELAAAYCGKYGAQEAKTYCENLTAKDALNRATLESLFGHIEKYANYEENHHLFENRELPEQLMSLIGDFKKMMQQSFVDAGLISVMKSRIERLIINVDKNTEESQDQAELLSDLRQVVIELARSDEHGFYNFEPCRPKKTETMGILCMMQQFEDLKDTLANKAIFSLGEILTIRANYDIYITSITAFLNLLDKFYGFYNSSSNFLISLEDKYFVESYDSIKSSLSSLKRQIQVAINKIEAIEREYISNHPGRKELTAENSVDWDETPTIYENTTIAHGHILHFKQKWKADGYSLGDLLYSLPLAPCQEKQIAIIDWDREERAARSEAQDIAESLAAGISRDRDISEIINSSFRENISASSHNKTEGSSGGIGGGIGGFVGKLFGGLFGGSSSSSGSSTSTANQYSARSLSGSTLNRLQDSVSQSASSLRSQRSTVIQTVGQDETVAVQTEVIKNNNHCHAMTVEYFEVLKHYAIEQELVDVQECLFVPLPMSHFDHRKILRWKNTLLRYIYGYKLRRGFDAIERIENNYADSDLPIGSYADEVVEDFSGHFSISFELERPYIKEIEEETKLIVDDWFPWYGALRLSKLFRRELTEDEKDAVFEAEHAPDIAREFIDTIDIYGIAEDGSEVRLDLDFTLLSNYRRGVPLQVNIASRAKQNVTRRQIRHLRFRANTAVKASSKIILRSAYLYYRTKHLNDVIIRNSRVNNDIINTFEIQTFFPPKVEFKTDAALMYTPLSDRELREPRKEDREAANALVSFLNEHMEMAHKIIWSSMDASRLFGLLDGYIAPNSGGRSVASVVENKVMGIVGNNLVLKVVPGERLDPVFKPVYENFEDLMAYYQPTTKPDPFRISVPTKGVYAESVMGKCNSCEEIDETRHWRFSDEPCGTKPTAIDSVSTDSRRADTDNLQVKDLPASIINMQNTPSAPDPTGLGAAFNLLGKSNVFKDMTGLEGTQANAIEALKTSSKSVTDLAGMAADLQKQGAMKKDIGKTLKTIDEAKKNKQITDDQANDLAYTALSSVAGKPTTKPANLTKEKQVENLIKSQSQKPSSNIKIKRGDESVEVSQPKSESKPASPDKKLSILGSPAPGTNPGSSKAQAHAVVTAFKTRSGDLKFNVTRTAVATNLTDLIDNPDNVNQGQLNLCGPAATVRTLLRRDPKLIADCVVQLVETGEGKFGRRNIEPDSDLKNQTYQSKWGLGAAEWVLMSSMRDDENWWFDFEGTPDEGVSAATTPGEIEDWLDETGLYSSVEDEANLVITQDIKHALGLSINNKTDNILLIHAHLLRAAAATNKKSDEFILSAFPNHWVVLNSAVTHTSGRVKLDVWSWGDVYSIDVPEATFEANYYGAVIAKA